MILPDPLLGSAEIVIQRWLDASGVAPLPDELNGKQLLVQVESAPERPLISLLLLIESGGLRLLPASQPIRQQEVDTTICGSPASLLALVLDKESETTDAPRLSGDLQLVRKLSAQLQQGDFNLETLLSEWTGPEEAYHLSRLVSRSSAWITESAEKLAANLRDYLQDETQVLVNPAEWQQLSAQVTDLERRAGALQRRLSQLQGERG
ncbi:MAG: hypothetical protein VW985_11500 [Gammaproteobacteria bacterium]